MCLREVISLYIILFQPIKEIVMKGNKVDDRNLDQVVGGVINDGCMAISIDGGNIIGVKSDETIVMSVADCKGALIDEGFSQDSVNKFMEMTKSGKDYNFKQVQEATGINIGDIIKKQF